MSVDATGMRERIPLAELNGLDREEFTARLGWVFEHSPWVVAGAWEGRPFADVDALHRALAGALRAAPPERQLDLIRAHPDLAGQAALAGAVTPESSGEQASAGLDRLSPEELERFHALNDAYRERFGFPFVVAVRDHGKDDILRAFEERLRHGRDEERSTALGQIERIAELRLRDAVEDDASPRRPG